MDSAESLRGKIAYLKDKSRGLSKKIRLDFHNLKTSILEAVFSTAAAGLGRQSLRPIEAAVYWTVGANILSLIFGARYLRNVLSVLMII